MNKLNRKIDMFCYKHPRFGIPNLMRYVAIITLAVWALTFADKSGALWTYLAFSPERILKGEVWRLVSFMFIPTQGGVWELVFLYFYYWIGNELESHWGTARFNIFVFSGVILTVIYGFILYFALGRSEYAQMTGVFVSSISMSYVYLSMFFSFATLFPDVRVLFMFIIPVKIKWLAYIDAAFFVYSMIIVPFPFNLLPLVAILNYFIFFGADIVKMFKKNRAGYNNATRKNFNREKQKMKYETKYTNYTRKCAVCGKTDAEYPDLEFRYCSRCVGYHCFCIDHINNHVHFTE